MEQQRQPTCSHQYSLNEQVRAPAQHRPSDDPSYYDGLFHAQTRPEQQNVRAIGNRGVMDYHLFAPKFQNHQDSTGRTDTWQPRHNPELTQTKRDQRTPFPTRTAPMVVPPQMTNASHPLKKRTVNNNQFDYRTAEERNEHFNRSIDSMHLPEDMQRPMATRDSIRAMTEEPSNEFESAASEYLETRQFSFNLNAQDNTLPLKGGGNFEDMFY